MKILIVFIFVFSFNSVAGNPGVSLSRPGLMGLMRQVDKIKKRSIFDLMALIAEASTHLGSKESLAELEAELEERSQEDPRMAAAKAFAADADKESKSIFSSDLPGQIQSAKQIVSVPDIRMAQGGSENGESSSNAESSAGQSDKNSEVSPD